MVDILEVEPEKNGEEEKYCKTRKLQWLKSINHTLTETLW